MAKRPEPVGVPTVAPTEYERELKRKLVDPIIKRVRESLATLDPGVVPLEAIRVQLAADIQSSVYDLDRIARNAAEGHVVRVAKWHRRRFLATFRKIGLDLELLMTADEVQTALLTRIDDNVRLIKSIPGRMHNGLTKRMQELATSNKRFNPGSLARVLKREYEVTGWNLRRIARDQTTKQIGQLTQIRHTQAGFNRYTWVTAGDNRVRPDHAANDGAIFAWASPPATGHPGHAVLCRCQAVAHVEDATIDRLAALLGGS